MRYFKKISSGITYVFIFCLVFLILNSFISKPLNAQEIKNLENGLRIIVREDHRNPLVVFSAFVDVGSANEGAYLGSGISHLLEHMLFKGTKEYPLGNIEEILHIYGGKIEAFTSYDYTGFTITILRENKNIALDVLKELLTAPLFNANELKKEKQVIEREFDLTKDDPGRRVSRLIFSKAYIRHPYRIPIIGYKENFKRLERNDVSNFFNSNYTPEKTVIAAVGDIDAAEVIGEIEKLFGNLPRRNNSSISLPVEPEQIADNYIEERADIDGAYLNIAFHSTSMLDKGLYAMDLLSFILGQGESSILNKEIRLKKELVLSITAYNYTPRDPGLFVIASVLKEENAKTALDEIIKTLEDVKKNGVPEEDLVKAKNNFLAGYIYQKESIESQAGDLAIGELFSGNPRFFEFYIDSIKSITREEIQAAAQKYLTKKNMTVAVLSQSGSALNTVSERAAGKKENEIKKIYLGNNLPLLVSENPTLPIVSISILFKGGLRLETEENNGISNLSSLMLLDGTNTMTREELHRFYESKGMAVNTFSANNSYGITVQCLKEHLEESFKLLSDMCFRPGFPQTELNREKKEINSMIDMQDDEIFDYGQRILKETLFKKHPYRFQAIGVHESIKRIQREDLINFQQVLFSANNMVIGISGDCAQDNIKMLADRYFSNIPLSKPEFSQPEKEPAIEEKREVLIHTDKEQSLILFGFHGVNIYHKDKYAVEVMVDSLSSESGILFKKIRENNGLSYAQGGFQVTGIDPGYIVLYTLTSKQNIEKVKKIIISETASFIKNGITIEELKKSQNHLKVMREISTETNSGFIFTASLDELYGLGCNNYKDYGKNIDAVTKEDVKRAAREFLTLDRCAVVVLEGTTEATEIK